MMRQSDLFAAGAERLLYDDAVELTLMSLAEHGPKHDHWAIAWSGGKDSTATLTLIVHLIEAGRLAPPKTLTVYYADTRQELTPLAIAAADTLRSSADKIDEALAEIGLAPRPEPASETKPRRGRRS